MKNILITGILILSFCFLNNVKAQTKEDSLAIKECSMNYIEGYYEASGERMEKALHSELVKRTIRKGPDGVGFVQGMGKTLLVFAAKMNKNERILLPDEEFKAEVFIYDIEDDYATVKITNNQYGFFDYAHLYKWEGEWKIVNVLWGMYPPVSN